MDKINRRNSQLETNQVTKHSSARDVSQKSKTNLSVLSNKSAKNSISTTQTKSSRIPMRERSSMSSKAVNLTPPQDKKFSLRKKSRTNLEINRQSSGHLSRTTTPKINSSAKLSIGSHTSSSMLTASRYRIGEVPSYLKKNEKNISEVTLNTKRKTFNSLKKKVEEQQTELLANYKALHEMQSKYNKSSGKTDTIDEIKLISVMVNDVEELLIKKEDGALKRALSPMKAAKDSLKLDQIKNKLKCLSTCSFNLCQDFFCHFAKLPSELDRPGGDGSAFDSQIYEVMNTLEINVRGIKDQMNFLNETVKELEEVSSEALVVDPKVARMYEEKINQLTKQADGDKSDNVSRNIELKQYETAAMKELKLQLTDKQVLIDEKDQEIARLKGNIKTLEEQKKDLDKQIQSISNDLATKGTAMKKLENEVDVYKSRSKQNDAIMEEVRKQKDSILEYVRREQEAIKQFEKEQDARLKLENDLNDREKLINKLREDLDKQKMSTALGGGDRPITENEFWTELQNLRVKLDKTTMEKAYVERERNDLQRTLDDNTFENLKVELIKASQEINHLNNTNNCLRDTIAKLEQAVSKKQAIINDLEQKITSGMYLTNTSKELQNELNSLRESEAEKKREIENLKCELSKARIEIKQQEETIYMHQRLLRIRSELINSLQEKEATNRCRMDDLYSEISNKTSLVNQMNHEISAKAEELQNLFSTLGTKQMELTRQEHIIKMLEENNERSQRLRVKQEEKIARLESENAEMKHVLKIANLKPTKV